MENRFVVARSWGWGERVDVAIKGVSQDHYGAGTILYLIVFIVTGSYTYDKTAQTYKHTHK